MTTTMHRLFRAACSFPLLLALPLASIACSDARDAGAPAPAEQQATDAGVAPEPGWCARVAPGPHGPSADVPLALSAIHADVRYFGAAASNREIDDALVQAIASNRDLVDENAAVAFARALESVCATDSDERTLPSASVERRGEIAIVHPGDGSPVVPADVAGWVLDLGDLPSTPAAAAALDRAVASVLPATFSPPASLRARVLRRVGLTDEVFAESALYEASTDAVAVPLPTGHADADRPLVVRLGRRMTPEAARVAVALRAANGAWIVGEDDLPVSVAESRWSAVGRYGVARRVADLELSGRRLPDVLPVDGPGDDATIASLVHDGAAPPPLDTSGEASRARIAADASRRGFKIVQQGDASVARTRAALLSAHGAIKLFFPYFGTIADTTDARLLETLADAAQVPTRRAARNLLRRLGAAITDGHNWVLDVQPTPGAHPGVLPVVIDRVGEAPVVARSYTTALAPGDTLLSIDGVSAGEWFTAEMTRTYGATEGFRFFNAAAELTQYTLPSTLRVKSAEGAERTESVTATPYSELPPDADLFAGSTRHRGWLADLGAPDVYYFNLDGNYVAGDADMAAGLAEAASARGVVLDMRGHPADGRTSWDPYRFLQSIIRVPFASPRYRVPVLSGDGARSDVHPYEETYTPRASPALAAPVVFIVDRQAVSFAEDFAMMLVGAGRPAAVVGRTTAGTTGSVTGMQLPGGFAFYFTGMEARWPDGRRFFGEGVVPGVRVEPTIDDFARGTDAFLQAAVRAVP